MWAFRVLIAFWEEAVFESPSRWNTNFCTITVDAFNLKYEVMQKQPEEIKMENEG